MAHPPNLGNREKPAARDSDEAARLARRVAEADVQVQIGYPRRFDPAFAAIRAAVAGGELGVVHTEVVAGRRASPCTVLDAIETGWVAEACTLSLREHRPVQIEEVRIP